MIKNDLRGIEMSDSLEAGRQRVTSDHSIVGLNDTESTHSIHKHDILSHELRSERVSERARERSGARERSEQCGAC